MFDFNAIARFQEVLPKVEEFLNTVLGQIKEIHDRQDVLEAKLDEILTYFRE